ncbi:aquaporin [Arthrobacter sp. YD2]|uniref:MIP/aquaporin family protein n=1 Tax=Arthrobacter sp. YD2 TaxID=3058046 RepID=UPI0025B3A8CE|nr:aquaporin [Arthrobacter sp. YD2]MDN3904118.1 aquaporin [Arthrobacter sp. YD2]
MSSEPLSTSGARAVTPVRDAASDTRGHDYGFVGRTVAEGIGSFLLVFAGIGVGIFTAGSGISPQLAFGLALAGAMVAFGYISGGHFNPAITLGSAVAGRTQWKYVLPYVLAQLLGAILAVAILWVAITGHQQIGEQTRQFLTGVSNGYGDHSVNLFPLPSALLLEVIAGALLTAVFLGSVARRSGAVAGAFAVGVTYAVLLTVLAPVTNGGINPARSTATAIFAEGWALQQLWLFWAAPLLGAVIAGLIFRSVDMTLAARSSDPAFYAVEPDTHAADETPASAETPEPATGSTGKPAARTGDTEAPVVDEEARGFFDKPAAGSPENPQDGTPGTRG